MINRLSGSLLVWLTLVGDVLADMAPPSPSPRPTGGISFGTHDVSQSLTPFGWLLVLVAILVAVFLFVKFARARKNESS